MISHPPSLRLITAMFLGLSAAGACGAAMPETDPLGPHPGKSTAQVTTTDDQTDPLAKRSPKDDAGSDAPKCPHGALEDPHRGFVRCLGPDEVDAGWLPPAPQPEPPAADAGTDASPPSDAAPPDAAQPDAAQPDAAPEKPQPPPVVTAAAPKFEGGEVSRVEKFINGQLEAMAKCIASNGGLQGKTGSFKVSFLVRERGRAEGVEVSAAKGIKDEAGSCIRVLLKNKAVGAPTADLVGVTVAFKLERAK